VPRDDVLWIETTPAAPISAPNPPRLEVTTSSAPPPVRGQPAEARGAERTAVPRGPPTEAAKSPQAKAAQDARSAPADARKSAPARRDPAGAQLTINSLNVQLVNEERPARQPPRRERISAPSQPDDWARFARQHLRVP
jgi:hypothetical protein